jgi:hypothetical protein
MLNSKQPHSLSNTTGFVSAQVATNDAAASLPFKSATVTSPLATKKAAPIVNFEHQQQQQQFRQQGADSHPQKSPFIQSKIRNNIFIAKDKELTSSNANLGSNSNKIAAYDIDFTGGGRLTSLSNTSNVSNRFKPSNQNSTTNTTKNINNLGIGGFSLKSNGNSRFAKSNNSANLQKEETTGSTTMTSTGTTLNQQQINSTNNFNGVNKSLNENENSLAKETQHINQLTQHHQMQHQQQQQQQLHHQQQQHQQQQQQQLLQTQTIRSYNGSTLKSLIANEYGTIKSNGTINSNLAPDNKQSAILSGVSESSNELMKIKHSELSSDEQLKYMSANSILNDNNNYKNNNYGYISNGLNTIIESCLQQQQQQQQLQQQPFNMNTITYKSKFILPVTFFLLCFTLIPIQYHSENFSIQMKKMQDTCIESSGYFNENQTNILDTIFPYGFSSGLSFESLNKELRIIDEIHEKQSLNNLSIKYMSQRDCQRNNFTNIINIITITSLPQEAVTKFGSEKVAISNFAFSPKLKMTSKKPTSYVWPTFETSPLGTTATASALIYKTITSPIFFYNAYNGGHFPINQLISSTSLPYVTFRPYSPPFINDFSRSGNAYINTNYLRKSGKLKKDPLSVSMKKFKRQVAVVQFDEGEYTNNSQIKQKLYQEIPLPLRNILLVCDDEAYKKSLLNSIIGPSSNEYYMNELNSIDNLDFQTNILTQVSLRCSLMILYI